MNSMMEYKGYRATVEFDAEDNIFVGQVFGINDSINFHGKSVEELKEMFRQSIDNYLELCSRIGKPPEKEYKGTFNIRISPEMHRRAALEAANQKVTLNQYIAKAIEKSFESAEREIMIYVPYGMRNIEWEGQKGTKLSEEYQELPVWTKKEVFFS